MNENRSELTRWGRDAGAVARRVGGETSNALTQREAWETTSETLRVLTEVVVAQHELIARLTERLNMLEESVDGSNGGRG